MSEPTASPWSKCTSCGFEAAAGNDEWKTVDHPPIGTITQCPECGSTNVHSRT